MSIWKPRLYFNDILITKCAVWCRWRRKGCTGASILLIHRGFDRVDHYQGKAWIISTASMLLITGSLSWSRLGNRCRIWPKMLLNLFIDDASLQVSYSRGKETSIWLCAPFSIAKTYLGQMWIIKISGCCWHMRYEVDSLRLREAGIAPFSSGVMESCLRYCQHELWQENRTDPHFFPIDASRRRANENPF